jgi:hypothetical protein
MRRQGHLPSWRSSPPIPVCLPCWASSPPSPSFWCAGEMTKCNHSQAKLLDLHHCWPGNLGAYASHHHASDVRVRVAALSTLSSFLDDCEPYLAPAEDPYASAVK